MPAIALSKVGSHRFDREDIVTTDAPVPRMCGEWFCVRHHPFLSHSRLCRIVTDVVDDNLGTMSPKLIAKIIRRATEPSVSVASKRSHERDEV
jgi:hypothetical protein